MIVSNQDLVDQYKEEDVNKPVIMIVDDEILNLEIMEEILIELGFEVITAISGEIAIENAYQLLSQNKKIYAIFMDFSMPMMYGDEVTAILRQDIFLPILHKTPIIGLTAHTDDDTKNKMMTSGMTRVEHKPFDINRIKMLLMEYKLISADSRQ